MNLLSNKQITVSAGKETPFLNKNGIYQDGTLPFCRDDEGFLWTLSGHSHLGHIGMFRGRTLDDLEEQYPIHTNFLVGKAGEAFDAVRYPEGVLPRGSIWPFGLLFIKPIKRFYCLFHNETGWNAHGTGYIIFGPGDGEPDFRHIGLMHSDDFGRTWDFDRWVITSEAACYSEFFRPEDNMAIGQAPGTTILGAGDFSVFVEGDYVYLYYGLLSFDAQRPLSKGEKLHFNTSDVYLARARLREDGFFGDFVKYYNGAFCEAGNLGKESPVATNLWHPRLLYSQNLSAYILTGNDWQNGSMHRLAVRTGTQLTEFSEPIFPESDLPSFGSHYYTAVSPEDDPYRFHDRFSLLTCDNGTDVKRFDVILR